MNINSVMQFIIDNPEIIEVIVYIASMTVPTLIMIVYYFIEYVVLGIALYNMAFYAGYDYPWLAFIPFANMYLMHMLPIKEYSYIGFYKTVDRVNGFKLYVILVYVIPITGGFLFGCASSIPFLGIFVSMLYSVLNLAIVVSGAIAKAIMRIDLMATYMAPKSALPIVLGVLSVFFRPIFPIAVLVLSKREPEFGYNNYYTPVLLTEEE